MADYKYLAFVKNVNNDAFDSTYHPATATPFSGIYRCQNCGHEAVSTYGHPLPPQNHHQHHNLAPILWRLTVASTHV
jgi:hypothetical protein